MRSNALAGYAANEQLRKIYMRRSIRTVEAAEGCAPIEDYFLRLSNIIANPAGAARHVMTPRAVYPPQSP